jgi:hypothetical protein
MTGSDYSLRMGSDRKSIHRLREVCAASTSAQLVAPIGNFARYPKAKIRLQSFFTLITIQSSFFASSNGSKRRGIRAGKASDKNVRN